jgi:hypothetical protein
MTSTEATLQRLLDYEDIKRALAIYSVAIDSRDFSLFYECFTPDAVINLAGMGEMTPVRYMEMAEIGLATMDGTQHHLGLPLIKLHEDIAHARTYFMAQHVKNALAPNACLLIGGWYTDDLVRTAEGWRIAKRSGTAVWYDGNPMVLGYDFPMGAVPRHAGHGVPGWVTG